MTRRNEGKKENLKEESLFIRVCEGRTKEMKVMEKEKVDGVIEMNEEKKGKRKTQRE